MTFADQLAHLNRPMTMQELCTALSVSNETVYGWIKKKRFPAFRIGRDWRFEPLEVLEWWEARRVGKR